MTAEKLLADAAAVVRDRRHTYGQPLDLFERVAVRWSQAEAEKRAGWRQHGILVVAGQEVHLTWPEQKLVRQLMSTLHGQRRLAPDA